MIVFFFTPARVEESETTWRWVRDLERGVEWSKFSGEAELYDVSSQLEDLPEGYARYDKTSKYYLWIAMWDDGACWKCYARYFKRRLIIYQQLWGTEFGKTWCIGSSGDIIPIWAQNGMQDSQHNQPRIAGYDRYFKRRIMIKILTAMRDGAWWKCCIVSSWHNTSSGI